MLQQDPLYDIASFMYCVVNASGTHWLCNLIHFMLHQGPLDDIASFMPKLIEMVKEEVIDSLPAPRILYTHLFPSCVPQEMFNKRARVILLYRNPKDTATSLFHHYRGSTMVRYNISWNCHI